MQNTDRQTLLKIARVACGASEPDRLGPLTTSPSDWPALLHRVEMEGLDGVLHDRLTSEELLTTIPSDVREHLHRRHTHRLLDYRIKHQACEELLHLAEEAGIRLLLLQGVAIAEALYPIGVRPLSDIDLLIRPDEFDRMDPLLTRLGYTRVSLYPPVYTRDSVWIDLHQQVAYLSRTAPTGNPLRVNEDTLWAAAVKRPFGTARAWTLSPADQIIILSAHLQKHSFSRLIWFVDIGLLLNRLSDRTQLETVWTRAVELRLERPLYFVCVYLREVLKLSRLQSHPLPTPSLSRAEERLASWLMDDRRIDGMGDLLYLLSIESPSARWQFLRQALSPRAEMMRDEVRSTSAIKISWGYLSRLSRLMWQAARLTVRLARSGMALNR